MLAYSCRLFFMPLISAALEHSPSAPFASIYFWKSPPQPGSCQFFPSTLKQRPISSVLITITDRFDPEATAKPAIVTDLAWHLEWFQYSLAL